MRNERKGIFVHTKLKKQIQKIADKNNRTIVGQLQEWVDNEPK